MEHKYLEELGLTKDDIPYSSEYPVKWDSRNVKWFKERRKCGFDNRETWDMGYTFALIVHERLRMFKDYAGGFIEDEAVEYKGEQTTYFTLVDKMIEDSGTWIKQSRDDWGSQHEENRMKDVYECLAEIHIWMWW